MKIHPRHIGFDIDGVVADTMEAFIRLAAEEYGFEVAPHDITEFQVEDCLDMDPSHIEEIFDRLLDAPLSAGLKLMPYAKKVLGEFAKEAPLTFITARPRKKPIADWLESMLGRSVYKSVRLVATGEHDGKTSYVKEMGLKYFVDDRVQTCVMLHQDGVTPYVFVQPWNSGKHTLQTVDSWLAIRELCVVQKRSYSIDNENMNTMINIG